MIDKKNHRNKKLDSSGNFLDIYTESAGIPSYFTNQPQNEQ